MSNDGLSKIFHNLNKWRHFPNYQLERRIDIFFSIYLHGVLEAFTGVPLKDHVIPEFPVRKENDDTHRTVKVDYLLISKDNRSAFFIELKTDVSSRRVEQDKYLKDAKKRGFANILNDLKDVMASSKSKQKYYHLLYQLHRLGALNLPRGIEEYLYPKVKRGIGSLIKETNVPHNPQIKIFYIQPYGNFKNCINFDFIIDYLKGKKKPLSIKFKADTISNRFMESLILWKSTNAGYIHPDGVDKN